MNREFLDLYNRELDLLYDHAREFAEEYPGIAGRLGGLTREAMDPSIMGLLEGSAFLASRVQLKLKHEFPEFINNLLEQLVPNFLAPTPAMTLVKVRPPAGDPSLREGRGIPRGAVLDAVYAENERKVACRYKLSAPIRLWPFEITEAEYFSSAAPLQALGLKASSEVAAGLKLTLEMRDAPGAAEAGRGAPESWFSACAIKNLPIHLLGAESDAIALYEQIFAHCVGAWLRCADEFGDPVVSALDKSAITQIGFDEGEALLPGDDRVFRGFELLREYFVFPRKFMAFDLGGLESAKEAMKAKTVSVILAFDEINASLAAAVQPRMFSLYTAPAVNLFEMTTDRVQLRKSEHEYLVVPDRSKPIDFEPHRILDVYAHLQGGGEKIAVRPLYSAQPGSAHSKDYYYTIRRLPRRRSQEEKKRGFAENYLGSDVYLSIGEATSLNDDAPISELSVRALCSNRHLPEHLPWGAGSSDFRFADDVSLDVMSVAAPSPPREPIVSQMRSRTETAHTGIVAWRLLNMLNLNFLGLVERGAGKNAAALREILATFADFSDSSVERRLRGVRSVESKQVVRRLRRASGVGAASGIEVTVALDDKAFEGSGVFLLGAILDRFLSEYASLNNFTQLVVRTTERGVIMRWPPRIGSRRLL
ncbi:type VI secretion system baseplate subunit TssF [Methylocystis heyeri]|uniref:Type VI secretion system baseplate subunit TssF n=1 Tax=Methylocystis heyeri TaxID=391905 RepID=A0A6B8KKS0_9HYPH|nr:type VI secretion system baseplate subunit TssF [Methylocystis heyeri]QGM47278.1 type VI secretion system baseplate subunit TssF [Methylocystis heyeri]